MKSIPEDDVILYADIGCTFNIEGKLRLGEYYSIIMNNGSLCFCMDHLKESEYTKSDTYFKIFPNVKRVLELLFGKKLSYFRIFLFKKVY